MRLRSVAIALVLAAAFGCGSSHVPLTASSSEGDAGRDTPEPGESVDAGPEDASDAALPPTDAMIADADVPPSDAGPAQDSAAPEPAELDASTSADAAVDAEPAPAWPAPVTDPPTPPQGPLPAPQPSAAGRLEACAFEPAEDAPRGASAACPDGVFRGDLLIDSAEDADRVGGCTRIEGDVQVTGGAIALRNFALVRVITGDLYIQTPSSCGGKSGGGAAGCQANVDPKLLLAPLQSLRCVGGDLVISAVNSELTPLASLIEVGGNLTLLSAASHEKPPLSALRRVWGTIEVMDTSWLSVLDTVYGRIMSYLSDGAAMPTRVPKAAVPSVQYLGCDGSDLPCRDGVLGCDLGATSNEALDAYETCSQVLGHVTVSGDSISDLSKLAALRTVKGMLWIRSTSVSNLNALVSLESVGRLTLESNWRLADVSALDGIAVGAIDVLNNGTLGDLTAWRSLEPVGDIEVNVTGNGALETLGDWPWLTRASAFVVSGESLTNLGRFDNLARVAMFSLNAVPRLVDAGTFPNLQSSHQIVVTNAPSLPILPAFPRLTSKLARLEIVNTGIVDMRGLPLLPLADEVAISENGALTSLDGLDALTDVVKRLTLDRNDVLRSVHGLSTLNFVGDLRITMNAGLTDCELEWLANRIGPFNPQSVWGNAGPGPCASP